MKLSFRTIAVLFVAFAICGTNVFSQKADDVSSKIANIKQLYKEIKSKEKTFKVTEITKSDEDDYEETTVSIYKAGKEIKLIITGMSGVGDCGESYEFYYHQSEVFFVFYSQSCYVGDEISKTERRFYFDGGKMIQFLDGKKKIKSETEDFKNAETEIKHLISEMKIYSK